MNCFSPNVSTVLGNMTKVEAMLGFKMDNVQALQSYQKITIFADPVFDMFSAPDGQNIMNLQGADLRLKVGSALFWTSDFWKKPLEIAPPCETVYLILEDLKKSLSP